MCVPRKLNAATLREFNSTVINTFITENFTARETPDYAPLQRRAINSLTISYNFKHSIEFTYGDFPCQ